MHRGKVPDVACPGCLGDRQCWVCLGTGRLRTRQGTSLPCHVCAGTGVCATCRDGRRDAPTRVVDLIPAARAATESGPEPTPRQVAG